MLLEIFHIARDEHLVNDDLDDSDDVLVNAMDSHVHDEHVLNAVLDILPIVHPLFADTGDHTKGEVHRVVVAGVGVADIHMNETGAVFVDGANNDDMDVAVDSNNLLLCDKIVAVVDYLNYHNFFLTFLLSLTELDNDNYTLSILHAHHDGNYLLQAVQIQEVAAPQYSERYLLKDLFLSVSHRFDYLLCYQRFHFCALYQGSYSSFSS